MERQESLRRIRLLRVDDESNRLKRGHLGKTRELAAYQVLRFDVETAVEHRGARLANGGARELHAAAHASELSSM